MPCQPWSVAGKRKGFDDSRGELWFNAIKLIEESKPDIFILENVKGLVNENNRASLYTVMESFRSYQVYFKVLNSLDFGLAQDRKRIFMIGFLDKSVKFKFPKIIKEKKTPDFFKFTDTRDGKNNIHSWDLIKTSAKEKEICLAILRNRRKKMFGPRDGNPLSLQAIKVFVPEALESDLEGLVKKKILKRVGFQFEFLNSKSFVGINGVHRIYNKDSEVFPTVVTSSLNDFISTVKFSRNKEEFIKEVYLKKKFRKLTSKEVSFLQGFPETFKHHKTESVAIKQLGNAVPVNVVDSLVECVFNKGR